MAGTDFIDAFRSTFMGQRDQVKAEKAAEKAEVKAKQAQANADKAQAEAKAGEDLIAAQEKVNTFLNALRDAAEKAVSNIGSMVIKEDSEAPKETAEPLEEEDIISYTYKPGDTFGQVIKNLGLNTDAGLWGEDGDVRFYTDQLYEQGALDDRGNIPIGTTIKLKRRK